MYSLTDLPYEVLSYVIDYLDLEDVYCLGRTSSDFKFIFEEERICKSILQTKLPHSNEALAAMTTGGGNARNLRRVLKRHDALATASPFLVATIGFCDAYIYCKGVLCYTLDDRIRVLNLHRSGQSELVIGIPSLLSHALSDTGENTNGFFQILYYSDYILSCIYKTSGPDSTSWLIAFNLRTRQILVAHELESTDKIFVRHNKQYLYYGTHSELGNDGYKKWVIFGYDFTERKWFEQKVHLPDMVGSEIGSTICFELYNGYFYGLSNQTSFEVEEIDWTSFYHCIRFPLNSPCQELLEKTDNKSMWRRQHQEGPIDDRWTHLRLVEDETSGELKIVEARKEWYLGSSKSQRTYYTTDLIFPKSSNDEDGEGSPIIPSEDSEIQEFSMPSWLPDPALSEGNLASTSSASSTSTSSSSSSAESMGSSSTGTLLSTDGSDGPAFPDEDEQLRKLVQKDDHPNYIAAPNRKPENTHPGHDGSAQPTITLIKCRVRTYNPSCSTFLDLVDDPHPLDWQGKQRLRLRAGTRKIGPVLRENSTGLLRKPSSDLSTALHEMYRVPPITFWPDAQDNDNPDERLDAIYRLMNPPSHLGNVEGTADERSMIYVTGSHSQPKALVFICFDPVIRLAGTKRWGMKGVGEGPHVDGRAGGATADDNGTNSREAYIDVGEADRTVSIDRKGKGKECFNTTSMVQVTVGHAPSNLQQISASPARSNVGAGRGNWAWKERAMYQDINLGYYFGKDRKK